MNLTIHNESPQDTFFQKIKFIYTAKAVVAKIMNMETLIQNMDPNKIVTLIFNSSVEVQEAFVERFEKVAKNLSKMRKVQEEEEQKELKANELQLTQTRLSLKEFEDR